MRLCWLYIGRICVYMVYILLGKCSYMHVVHEYVIRDILIVPLTHHFTCSPSLGSLPTSLPVHHHWVHYLPPYLFTITIHNSPIPTHQSPPSTHRHSSRCKQIFVNRITHISHLSRSSFITVSVVYLFFKLFSSLQSFIHFSRC